LKPFDLEVGNCRRARVVSDDHALDANITLVVSTLGNA
jgi:hypothetical protein